MEEEEKKRRRTKESYETKKRKEKKRIIIFFVLRVFLCSFSIISRVSFQRSIRKKDLQFLRMEIVKPCDVTMVMTKTNENWPDHNSNVKLEGFRATRKIITSKPFAVTVLLCLLLAISWRSSPFSEKRRSIERFSTSQPYFARVLFPSFFFLFFFKWDWVIAK